MLSISSCALVFVCRLLHSTHRKLFWVASQDKYCREVKVDGKQMYVPYNPQPSRESIVIVGRYYATEVNMPAANYCSFMQTDINHLLRERRR